MTDILDFVHNGNVAVYVAGDGNIFIPAIVAINSIKKRNLECFDFFICFSQADLDAEKISILKKFHINFINTDELDFLKKVSSCEMMNEGAWPKEVLYNWGIPLKLNDLHYTMAVKIDYDLLCVEKWNINEIDPQKYIFGAAYWKQILANDNVNYNLCKQLQIDCDKIDYFNAGFSTINIKRYVDEGIFDSILKVYKILTSPGEKVSCAEQVAIGVVLSKINNPIRKINGKYNVRTTTIPEIKDNGEAIIVNLHFLTSNKPWKPISFKYLPKYVDTGERAQLFMYRNIWIKEAFSIKEINRFLDVKEMSDFEYLGMMGTVFKAMYKYQNELKYK